jgi:hypothetical protein
MASSTPAPNTLVRPDLVVANITIIPGKPLDTFGNVTISGTLTVDARQIINKTVDMFDIQLFNYTDKTEPIPKVDVLIGGDSCLEVKSARTRGVNNGGDRKTFTVRVQVGLRRECVTNTATATQGNVVPEGEFPVVAVAAGAAGGFCCLLLTVVVGVVICRKADRGADENGVESAAPIDKRVPVQLHQLRVAAADVPYTEMAIPPGDYDHGRFDAPVDKRVPVELHQLRADATLQMRHTRNWRSRLATTITVALRRTKRRSHRDSEMLTDAVAVTLNCHTTSGVVRKRVALNAERIIVSLIESMSQLTRRSWPTCC